LKAPVAKAHKAALHWHGVSGCARLGRVAHFPSLPFNRTGGQARTHGTLRHARTHAI
jgi:hypothetical protein